MILTFLLLPLLSLFFEVNSEKILALAFVSGQSFRNAQQDLLVELAKRGHEFTIVNSYKSPKSNSHPNIREINGMTFEDLAKNDKFFNPFEMRIKGTVMNPFNLLPAIELLCNSYYEMPEIKELLKEKFDLIILSSFINECTLGIPVHMKTNFMIYNAFGIPNYISGITGAPSPPSFVPIVWSGLTHQMNFFERISQIWITGRINYKYYFDLVPRMEKIYRNVFSQDFPSAADIYRNVSLIVSNSHFSINYPRPFLPDSIEVAGMHCKDAKPLPKDLEDFVSGGKDGFIFFSMGSVVPAHKMPDQYRRAFLAAFKEIKQRVIWKWETGEMKETLPDNVKLVKWAPQQDILGHSKIRVFITHGGMLSTQEAVHHGVPLLGIPMFGDQDWNMAMTESGGYAIKLEFSEITKESVLTILGKLLNDPRYMKKAKELSSVFRDRESNPLDTAVFWTEYVMRHKGAPQLRSPARDLSFFANAKANLKWNSRTVLEGKKSFSFFKTPFVGFFVKSLVLKWRRFQSSLTSSLIIREWKSFESNANSCITSIIPSSHQTLKLVFANHEVAEFKYIWLRDNCNCTECVHSETRQKLLDSPSLDVNSCKLSSFFLSNEGQHLVSVWKDSNGTEHFSTYDSSWLSHYGKILMKNSYEGGKGSFFRPQMELWDRTSIWTSFPHHSYEEICENDEGLRTWLEMFHKFRIAFIRKVPPEKHRIIHLVNRFAYVKETSYGVTFDVINQPEDPQAHLANSGAFLYHHTDMNYREKSPGMQILHCIKNSQEEKSISQGGMSFFVDGFRIAKWMEENDPAAFHLLTTTPVHFTIRHKSQYYSHKCPVICVDEEGEVTEIHYNNRTMGPLEAPSHVILSFYHSYKIFSMKMRESAAELKIQLAPGDVVAFNNRRVLHGRTAFNPAKLQRHLEGCYVNLDEAVSKYDQLSRNSNIL